jgi:hypothetical protein
VAVRHDFKRERERTKRRECLGNSISVVASLVGGVTRHAKGGLLIGRNDRSGECPAPQLAGVECPAMTAILELLQFHCNLSPVYVLSFSFQTNYIGLSLRNETSK